LVRNGLNARPYDDWIGLWKTNPAYERRGGPIGWVLENRDGALVGTIGNTPGEYRFRGRDLRSASASDWAVDEPYRRYSLTLLDVLTRQPGVDLLVCSTVSAASEPAYRPFGWSRVPAGNWDASDFWITNYRGFSRALAALKSMPFAGTASCLVSAGLFCVDRLKGAPGQAVHRIEPCELDSYYDDFWRNLESEQRNTLMAVRTRETLAWHARRILRDKTGWILACRDGHHIGALAMFERRDNPELGLTRVCATDFQALRGHESKLRSVLAWMWQKCREERIDVLENPGCWLGIAGRPAAPGVRRRALPAWTFYYRAANRALHEELKEPRVWRPSLYDGDASL
jgi:hypothetical protein